MDGQLSRWRKWFLGGLIFIVVAGVVVVVVMIMRRASERAEQSQTTTTPTGQEAPGVVFTGVAPDDKDGDGVKDEEETKLGTKEWEFDSDYDGLADSSEIQVWKTDPKNPDTDGDGYKDGVEVVNGFNPLGAGKIQ